MGLIHWKQSHGSETRREFFICFLHWDHSDLDTLLAGLYVLHEGFHELILGGIPKGSSLLIQELLRSHCNTWELPFFFRQR
jgi:hypothetical protein